MEQLASAVMACLMQNIHTDLPMVHWFDDWVTKAGLHCQTKLLDRG